MSEQLPEYTVEALEAEGRIVLPQFAKEDALQLGTLAATVIRESGRNLAVDIVIDGDLVYRAKLGTTGPGNDEWLAGKAAVAGHFAASSLLVRRRQEATGIPFTDLDLDHSALKAHGGSVPLFVGERLVGTITMSGEPDVIDHQTVMLAITRYLVTI